MYIRFIASKNEEKHLQHTHGIITQAKIMLDEELILHEYHREHIEKYFLNSIHLYLAHHLKKNHGHEMQFLGFRL